MSNRINSKPMRAGIASLIVSGTAALYFFWSPFYWDVWFDNDNPGHVAWAVQCIAGFGMTILSVIAAALVIVVAFIALVVFVATPLWALYTWIVNGEVEWLFDA